MEKNVWLKRIYELWNNISLPARSAFSIAICSVFSQVLTVLMTMVLTRLISTGDFGVSSNYAAWYSVISCFFTMNLNAGGYNNAMLIYENKRDEYTSSILGLSILIGGIGLVIACSVGKYLESIMMLPYGLIIFMAIQCLFYNPYGCWISRAKYEYNYKNIIKMTLIISIGSAFLSVFCTLLFKNKAEGKVFGTNILTIIAGGLLLLSALKKCPCLYNVAYWKYALKFNVPLIPHYLSLIVLNQSDRIMITKMSGSSENGLYSLAYTASTMILFVNNALIQALIPWTYSNLRKYETKKVSELIPRILLLYMVLVVIYVLVAPELIYILAGDKYANSVFVVPPVVISMYFILLYNVYSMLEFYHEKTKGVMICSVCSAILNIVLNYIFIKKFGYVAAAFTTLFCYILNSLLHVIMVYKIYKLHYNKEDILSIRVSLIIGLALIIFVFFSEMIYSLIVIRYFFLSVLALIIFRYKKEILNLALLLMNNKK